MKRTLVTISTISALALTLGVLAVIPGIALGTITEIGVTTTQIGATSTTGVSGVTGGSTGSTGTTGTTGVTGTSPLGLPQCPGSPCLAVSKTTGFQVKIGTDDSLFSVPQAGSIVAWSITLGSPTSSQTTYFDGLEGGPASAGIAVLKGGKHLDFTLVAQSPIVPLLAYFGETAQFPLANSIPVKKGEIVALTVPTWAPALAIGYGKDTSWRASRAKHGCKTTSSQEAQQSIASTTQYYCLYQKARLTYSATLISTP
jgi:hypothetical protein